MKKFLLFTIISAGVFALNSCKHSAKDPDIAEVKEISKPAAEKDDIVRETVQDRYGDQMEILTNNTKNTVIVRLNGQTYELEKDFETPTFSTEDNQYQYSQTKYEVTLLKKNADMVLFHGQRVQQSAKMASQ